MSNYASKVAAEVHDKYKKLDAGADFGLVCSEFTNAEEFFGNFSVTSSSIIVVNEKFDYEKLIKVIERNVAMVTCLEHTQCNFLISYA